jgi:hypothetical protein
MCGLFIEKCSYEIFRSKSKDRILHYGFYVIKSHDLKGNFFVPTYQINLPPVTTKIVAMALE